MNSDPSLQAVSSGDTLRRAEKAQVELSAALFEFLPRQRWFAGRSERLETTAYRPMGALPWASSHLLGEAVVVTPSSEQRYFLPLVATEASSAAALDGGPALGLLRDATHDPAFCRQIVTLLAEGRSVDLENANLNVERSAAASDLLAEVAAVPETDIKVLSGEQSNTSVGIGRAGILKFYRLLRDGEQPELEVTKFLTERTDFEAAPALLGSIELERADGSRAAVVALFERVDNRGDAWSVVTDDLVARLTGTSASPSAFEPGETLGRRTGQMHAALATRTGDPAFDPEPLDEEALRVIVSEARHEAGEALDILSAHAATGGASTEIDVLLAGREAIDRWFDGFAALQGAGLRTRIHGDYHLGQVLVSGDDVVILDFEGEPGRPLTERRAKTSPLRDVAGMLRSFDYAAFAARDRLASTEAESVEKIRQAAEDWRDATSADFLSAWQAGSGLDLSEEGNSKLLDLFLLQKAFYELRYEAAMRPAWLSIPLRGIVSLLRKRQVLP